MRKFDLIKACVVFLVLWVGACATDEIVEEEAAPPQVILSGQENLSWELEVGESAQGEFLITNIGERNLEFDVIHDGDWLEVSPSGGGLGEQVSQTVDVEVTCPDEAGQYSATFQIVSNDPEQGEISFDASLNCTAIPPGSLEIVVAGLPQDLDGQVQVAGPEGFSESVIETTLFEEVVLGEYRITASPVGDEVVYVPEPETVTVEIERQDSAVVHIDYEVVPGSVQVEVQGLPDGLDPVMELTGDGGSWTIPADGRVDDLEPGLYTVIPEDLQDGETLYKASQADVSVVSEEVASVTITYLVDPGALQVDVSGLPDGVNHDIDLVDSEGDVISVPQSGELAALEPGAYDVVPRDVEDGLATYEAEGTTVVVESGETATVDVDYEVIFGQLAVTIDGLDGLEANVELVRDGQAISVTETSTFDDLHPGTYAVEVGDVTDGPARFEAPSTSVDVASGAEKSITIEYELILGDLVVDITGDLGGVAADVQISGPSFSDSISSSESYPNLLPGEYVVTANDVTDGATTYEGTGATVIVESGQSITATVVYEVIKGSLPVVINGLPDELDADVDFIGDGDFHVDDSKTVHDIVPGTYQVVVNDVEDGIFTYQGQGATVVVESGVNDPFVVTYELVYAELVVEIDGDLGGAEADVHIAGPDGFTRTVTGEETVENLVPGEYSITVNDVFDGALTYEGQGSVDHTLASGDSETVVASYELLTSGIAVDVVDFGDPDFEVLITGPDNFSEIITGSTVFTTVVPGDYELTVESLPVDGEGNEGYVNLDPSSFTLNSDETFTVTIEAAEGGIVTHGGDAGPGSLRQVMENVVDGTVVEIDEGVSQISLTSGEIVVDGVVGLVNSHEMVTIDGNGGRIFFVSPSSLLLLDNLLLRGGEADRGGAIFVDQGVDASNRSELYVFGSIFEENHATEHGGAIFANNHAEIVIFEAVFENNSAGSNGGAYGTSTTSHASLWALIEASYFEGNSANNGGALYLTGDTYVRESTFYDNSAVQRGGAIYVYWQESILEGITVTGNSADDGGGIFHWSDGFATGAMGRSIVAANQASDDPDISYYYADSTDDFVSVGYNVVGVASGDFVDGAKGDQAGSGASPLDPGLEAPADNGGFSKTMALSATSPARLNVPVVECEEMSSYDFLRDQRRERRPAGAFCSAGAYEIDARTETFANAAMSAGSYQSGNFEGDNGIIWFYEDVRRDTDGYVIEDRSVILQQNNPDSRIYTQTLTGGVSSVSMQLSKAFTASNDRQVDLYINGDYIASSEVFDEPSGTETPYPVYRFAVEDIDVDGDFVIEVRNAGAQIVVDNITWE